MDVRLAEKEATATKAEARQLIYQKKSKLPVLRFGSSSSRPISCVPYTQASMADLKYIRVHFWPIKAADN